MTYEDYYIDLLKDLMLNGNIKTDRTGTGTRSLFAKGYTIDIENDFPLLTTKKVSFHNIAHELLWFMGNHYTGKYTDFERTNIKYLVDNNVRIWDDWPYEIYVKNGGQLSMPAFREMIKRDDDFARANGNLGPVYGKQWTAWGDSAIDQILLLEQGIKNNPFSRRHVLGAWNVDDIGQMALPSCHLMTIFYCHEQDGETYLSCDFKMRSNDYFLGNPYNIASYALLTYMLAKVCGMKPKYLNFSATDVHLYSNHIEQANLQIHRYDNEIYYEHPKLEIKGSPSTLRDICFEDFDLIDYKHCGSIKAPIAV